MTRNFPRRIQHYISDSLTIPMTERDLVVRAQSGDLAAFSELVEKQRAFAHAYAYARLGNVDDAYDAVQEAFIDAYLGLAHLRDAGKFWPWLATIIARCCARLLGERQRQVVLAQIAVERCTDTFTDDTLVETRAVLAKLNDKERALLELSAQAGLSYEEIAARLGISIAAIKSRLHRAREKLRKEMMPMSEKHTRKLTKAIVIKLLEKLAETPGQITVERLQQLARNSKHVQLRELVAGLLEVMAVGVSFEEALWQTRTTSAATYRMVGWAREWKHNGPLQVAVQMMQEGLIQSEAPIKPAEIAYFCACYACLLQTGVSISRATEIVGEQVPAMAGIAKEIVDNFCKESEVFRQMQAEGKAWEPGYLPPGIKMVADIFAEHAETFTPAFATAIRMGEDYGTLDTVLAALAAYIMCPRLLRSDDVLDNWSARVAEAVSQIQANAAQAHYWRELQEWRDKQP
jgi:RNA polymerase sigma-70 factor, ECF subfamily